ncbi:MAG: (2Fe-2S)-binding protein [Elusimicrobia bacterium]|nr:(2Fe-2S)-binding protein [Elusimicrobiota bacterium]
MPRVTIDGLDLDAERGDTLLDAARHLGIEVPTLCHMEGLTPWGGCRLCIVEVGAGTRSRLVTSCTYPVEEGLKVRTNSKWVIKTRRMVIELMLGACSGSKELQDLAAKYRMEEMRFKPRHDDCILCGRCVRMCDEQMTGSAIGFLGRGQSLTINTPFDKPSAACRRCGGCMYVCPICTLRCQGPDAPTEVCGRCGSMAPTCSDVFEDYTCYMGAAGDCGTCVREEKKTAASLFCAPEPAKVTVGGK